MGKVRFRPKADGLRPILLWRVDAAKLASMYRRLFLSVIAVFLIAAALPPVPERLRVPFASLRPTTTLRLGETADWVLPTADAVWVASTGPFAVHRIDPNENRVIATIELPGEPCAGIASGFG